MSDELTIQERSVLPEAVRPTMRELLNINEHQWAKLESEMASQGVPIGYYPGLAMQPPLGYRATPLKHAPEVHLHEDWDCEDGHVYILATQNLRDGFLLTPDGLVMRVNLKRGHRRRHQFQEG